MCGRCDEIYYIGFLIIKRLSRRPLSRDLGSKSQKTKHTSTHEIPTHILYYLRLFNKLINYNNICLFIYTVPYNNLRPRAANIYYSSPLLLLYTQYLSVRRLTLHIHISMHKAWVATGQPQRIPGHYLQPFAETIHSHAFTRSSQQCALVAWHQREISLVEKHAKWESQRCQLLVTSS